MDKYTIAYEQGYTNWYVSEFYKYFHIKLEEKTGIKFNYIRMSDLAEKFGYQLSNNSDTLFSWFNLVIMNEETEKMFIHSWYDYANVTLDWCVKNQFNVVKFSFVSNLDENYLNKYEIAQPSVYYFENWSDHDLVKKYENSIKSKDRIYFAAYAHGIRAHIMDVLKINDNFEIYDKRNPEQFRQKELYYDELSSHKFSLSLNGAANICYRDLEIFALNSLNLRQPITCKTYNPILPNVHYIEFIDNDFLHKILTNQNIDNEIKEKVDFITDFYNSADGIEMIKNGKDWYIDNCLPENQFSILYSFLNDLTILD